jgi:hypothetical protein
VVQPELTADSRPSVLVVVVSPEVANTGLVKDEMLTERQRFADQVRTALAWRVIQTLDVGSLAGLFADRAMTLGGQDNRVGIVETGIMSLTQTPRRP